MPEQIDYDSDDSSVDSTISNDSFHVSNDDFVDCDDFSLSEDSDDEDDDPIIAANLSKSLVLWALSYGISHNALTSLLKILRHFGKTELPIQAKTLLKTPRTRITVRACPPGEAYYYGIQNSLLNMRDAVFHDMSEIVNDFFIDGLSVSESSTQEIWPIIGSFVGRMNLNPFLVHAYAGPGKPKDNDDYMREFTEEMPKLVEHGVLCGPSRILKPFKVRGFICDAPASAFITGRIGHSSYHGCPKCDQICTRNGSRMLYQYVSGNLRTDESFVFREDPNHHRPEFLTRHSLLEECGVGHVSQFTIDPMHLLDLANTKRVTVSIVNSLSKAEFERMENRFLSFRPYTPSEFERKPRTLKQLKKFRANEFKQLLSYSLPVLITDIVNDQVYYEVLTLHVAVRLLQDPQHHHENVNAARELINIYVREFSQIFGAENFTYYTHCLLHIPDAVEEFGQLYSFSAYKHENHLRVLKQLLRKKDLPLQQFYNRFAEISIANEIEHNLMDQSFQYNSFILKANSLRDGCCMVLPGVPLEVTELIEINGTKYIRGRRYLHCENFYLYPVASIQSQGTILASRLSPIEEDFSADSVLHKYYRLPLEDKFVLIPLIFTS